MGGNLGRAAVPSRPPTLPSPSRGEGSGPIPPPSRGRAGWGIQVGRALGIFLFFLTSLARAQEPEIERPGPPPLDTLEADANGDGVPDGWYNLRDARWIEGGVIAGARSRCFRFENARPGRPARASRAFGLDGRTTEAIVVGLWVRAERIGPGERLGDEPGLLIDFLGDQLRAVRRGTLGPWTKTVGPSWTRVVKRFSIPPTTRDAILSVGLLGATGLLDVDELSIELIPAGSTVGTSLIVNGGFELGDPAPASWVAENGARRAFPGYESAACVELTRSGSRLLAGVGIPVDGAGRLRVALNSRGRDLRGADAALGGIFFLDEDARPLPGPAGSKTIFRFSGNGGWTPDVANVEVPPGASRAVLQFEKTNGSGTFALDDVSVTADAQPADWRPYHVTNARDGWAPVVPSDRVEPGSALDASGLLDAPAGKHGFVGVVGGRLGFARGGRARFFGVQVLPPFPFLEPERTDALADRLAASGVNLVRLGDLDSPLGPARGLFDDAREDTREFDPIALARLDHFIAALKKRGIYVAIELQSARRFRADDDVPSVDQLPIGGGPAAIFDPKIRAATLKAAEAILTHVNPETSLALKDDPALAWVTLFGELSLFDLLDDPQLLPASLAASLKARGLGRRAVESAELKGFADALRSRGLGVPIAGVSHWRREAEFSLAAASTGLDLVDDRLYWNPPPFLAPTHRTLVRSRDWGQPLASKKRKPDRPYVVGQWCAQTSGAWALPYEGADLLTAAATAAAEDWDALVRRGIFVNPERWGFAAPGTSGGEDLYQIPEALNANPQVYGLLPHAASVLLRDTAEARARKGGRAGPGLKGWDPRQGRLAIETPHTVALAGWPGGTPLKAPPITIGVEADYAVVAASSLGKEPLSTSRRLLVTAVARVEPTGLAWVDDFRREVADVGAPPLLAEPVRARVSWRRAGEIKAYRLDPDGRRAGPAVVEKAADGATLVIDGRSPGMHWELVVE